LRTYWNLSRRFKPLNSTPPEPYTEPYLYICLILCKDKKTYDTQVKDRICKWIEEVRNQEWIIVYISLPQDPARKNRLGSSEIFFRINPDLFDFYLILSVKISVRMENETQVNRFLRVEVQAKVGPIIDNNINTILEAMKAKIEGEGAKISPAIPSTKTEPVSPVSSKPSQPNPTQIISSSNSSSTRSFVQKVYFDGPIEHIYQTLTDQNGVTAFTLAPAKIDNKPGGEFSILDGAIVGTQVELVPLKKIVQKWRFQNWPENHYSTVTLTFTEERGGTLISLTQTDIPSSDLDRTRNGWERFFWIGLRNTFGWSYKYQ